ncbi:glycosyltransferase family 4 protein [Histidinibacterium lentulum]|uniref:Glycosyltransferase family 1 protein n=1 Tax=Histidinibacterium lentulum TaxID=2480588 RepID=A0A3N2QYI2_9RHOB|nr:glycosyltransferase family 4 protein [Histidinibacterium lentulum]ROU00156.1 glycosyltransferase family 1 protein [Histidinibacterium lentulum]
MRIAYVCTDPGIPVFGTKGASIHVQEMLRAFVSLGAEVTLLSPRLEGTPPGDLARVATAPLPLPRKGNAEDRARDALALNAEVVSSLRAAGPLDMIYERHALYAHAAMETARDLSVPGLLEVNAPLSEEQARHRTLARPEAAEASARRAMEAAHAITAVSPAVAAHCRSLGGRIVEVVPNAISPDRFPEVARPEGAFTVGFLGSLKPWHDVDSAIAALAILREEVPDARLVIIGDGPERDRLVTLAADLGVADAVEFTGAVAPDSVPGQLARLHVGLAPYPASENFYFSPLKIYEYMAAGLAVVTSRSGHLPEVVDHGRTGLLTAPGDRRALAAALADLARDPARREALGREARAEVLATRTWDGVASRVLALAGIGKRSAA